MDTLLEFFTEHQRTLTIIGVLGLIILNFIQMVFRWDEKEKLLKFKNESEAKGEELHAIRMYVTGKTSPIKQSESALSRVKRAVESFERIIGDLESEIEDLRKPSQALPDVEAMENKISHLEKQERKLTSSRDNFRNDAQRYENYYHEEQKAHEKTRSSYQSKLAKLRSAIREEDGYYLELDGRKIKVLREEG